MLYGPGSFGQFEPVIIHSIHVSRVSLRQIAAGRCACFAVRSKPSAKRDTEKELDESGYLRIDLSILDQGSECPCRETHDTRDHEKGITELREELRISHSKDPRRRRLRVDDPDHPANKVVAPVIVTSPKEYKTRHLCQSLELTNPMSWPFNPGMVLISSSSCPVATFEFDARILVLNHPNRYPCLL